MLDRFAILQINLKTPDLNQDNFSQLTITRQIRQVEAEFPHLVVPVTLIGSSLGGFVAAWLGQRQLQVQRLVLLAPAFHFLSNWLPQLGKEQLDRYSDHSLGNVLPEIWSSIQIFCQLH